MLKKKDGVKDIYNLIARDYSKTFLEPSDYIENFLKLLSKKGKILDVGCGVGVDSNFIKSKGFIPIGIDLSREMLKIAKNRYPAIDFRLGNMKNIKFKKGKFDGIIASYSLIHITKKELPEILKLFSHLLKENSFLYISLQSGRPREIFIDEPFDHSKKLFLNVISFPEINKLLKNSGFEIINEYKRKAKKDQLNFKKLFIIAQKKPE